MTRTRVADVDTAVTYRLLSLGVSTPREETLEEMAAIAAALASRTGPAPEVQELAELLPAADAGELATDWERLFDGDPLCPPYEGSYEADPFRHLREMADVNGFYLAFGAEPHGPAAERPDHAGCELEFLSFLVLRRLCAEDDDAKTTCREAENAFLLSHLGRFGPAFFRRLREHARAPFYECLARLGERHLAVELERRGLRPEPLRIRRRLDVEADCLTCPQT